MVSPLYFFICWSCIAQIILSPSECLPWAIPEDLYGLSRIILFYIYRQTQRPPELLFWEYLIGLYGFVPLSLQNFQGRYVTFPVVFFSFSKSWPSVYSILLGSQLLSIPVNLPVFCYPFSFPLPGEMISTILIWNMVQLNVISILH